MNNSDNNKETQQLIIQSNNYNVTVIPIDYTRNRNYNTQNSDYVMEQYK